jgi:cytosine/adenosine deaminase-related metal-dependent hydrolase
MGLFTISLIAERTRTLGMQGNVTISHAFCLAEDSPASRAALDQLAELDIALTSAVPGSQYGLPLRAAVDAGVRAGLGMDGQRDFWWPYGNGDMLDRAWLLAFTQGFIFEPELELALAVSTWGGHSVMDSSAAKASFGGRPGVDVGDPAELVLLGAESAASAVMDRPGDRVVIHRGGVVARDGEWC